MSTSETEILPVEKFKHFLDTPLTIGIYGDVGVTSHTYNSALYGLMQVLGTGVTYKLLKAPEVISGAWREDIDVFVMPGGATTPMHEKLTEAGCAQIREYVNEGGRYIGFCAGAYFGAAFVEFAKGDPDLERITERELGFFPGTAVGPVFAGFKYHELKKSLAVRLSFPEKKYNSHFSYFNGGCYFKGVTNHGNTKVISTYPEKQDKAAIIMCTAGDGKALLCGPHIEYVPELLPPEVPEDVIQKLLSTKEQKQNALGLMIEELLSEN